MRRVNKMNITYAPIKKEDIDTIYAFCKKLIDDYEDLDSIDYDKVLAWVKRKIEKRADEYKRVLIGGDLAGFYRFHEEDGEMEIDDLYILPEYRGMGIGTKVLEKCLYDTDKTVFFYVFTKNERAIKLYKSLGFTERKKVGDTRIIMAQSGRG